jgi:YHS domain-containing protein
MRSLYSYAYYVAQRLQVMEPGTRKLRNGGLPMQQQQNQAKAALDPVCGMTVNQRVTEIATTIQDQTYFFCAEGCRKAFVADPQKYLNPAPSKRKGWWGRYLDRLEKATGGKSMNCH